MRPASELQQRISYAFRDAGLLERALTHKSFANENRLSENNERMEFLGDAVLDLVVSEQLMAAWPDASEGRLSRLRAGVVSEQSLSSVARAIGLGAFLRLGRGEEQTGGRNKDSLLANALEALVASLYLDGGISEADSFVRRHFAERFSMLQDAGGPTDHKTALQEICQERLKALPEYRITSEDGPDHEKRFTVELTVQGAFAGRGTGRSKKEAEQMAAKEALEKLRSQGSGGRSRTEEP
jgi:ribonuclease-3